MTSRSDLLVLALALQCETPEGLPTGPDSKAEQCYRMSLDERGFSDQAQLTRCLYGHAAGVDGGGTWQGVDSEK